MRSRPWIWILLCLLLATGAWLLWLHGNGRDVRPARPHETVAPAVRPHLPSGPAVAQAKPFTILSTNHVQAVAVAARTNQFAWRLSNTTKPIGELMGDPHAILLANALIDTSAKLDLSIPKQLQAPGEPGAYIVQANGPIDNAFRAMLARSGAQIVSYIPNNAYLVTVSAGNANALAGNPMMQAVVPYEPYYKISSSMPVTIERKTSSWTPIEARPAAQTTLLDLAVGQKPLPAGTYLTLGLFNDGATATVAQIEKLGGQIVAREDSPFGPVVRVQPPADWVVLAALPGVHIVEPSYRRASANDLSRATVGVAVDTQTPTNYLGLTGKNVLVEVNDSGIDATHPDLTGRIIPDSALSLVDTNGHGTHVAGTIAGSGFESTTVTNAQGSIMPGTNGQFRGMAPLATLYSVAAINNTFSFLNFSDRYLQEAPALTNALISNNSWNYDGDNAYDLAAASYDAAVRDALPQVTGSQPVLFVFAAGNDGSGDDTTDPGNGTADSIASPATAKNVITVGAIQEFRNITNEVTNADGTISAPWQAQTSTSYRIAGFSSRGNVGIGTEGTYGRFKPDVVAPGTSIISTRSSQWDIGTYFFADPTNNNVEDLSVVIQADTLGAGQFPLVPTNTVQITIQLFTNADSPFPFPPDLPIYFGLVGSPAYDYSTFNNQVSIPPDGGLTIPEILSSEASYGFNFAVSNITSEPINFDIILDTITTNYPGNYFLVYSNLDQSLGTPSTTGGTGPGPYYRFETGTSMSAADVSGVLALMQDYFTNTLQTVPSPALLKAMLINGARPTGAYDLQVQNNINFEGWGLINLPNSLPPGVTNVSGASCSSFFIDQNPTNALATGDSHTFVLTIDTNTAAQTLPLRITLAWTDPPGDPAAAIKLVNSLGLVVSNGDTSVGPVLYYGNDIASGSIYNTPESMNTPAIFDAINNVENVFISPPLGTTYTITVSGRDVNVNAVTAQTNNAAGVYEPNIVQDFALVVSCGEGEVTNSISSVTDNGIVSNPTGDQQVSFLGGTNVNAPLLNQMVGASSPLLGTNTIPAGTNFGFAANAIITLGMTNQWHFYVVTNPPGASLPNAGFITFLPDTLSVPRMGVFADNAGNATTPSADVDLYVTTDPTLTNLNPMAIANCVNGTQVGLSAGGVFNGASLSRGGTEFVVDTNSLPGEVYYVGVQSERQVASEYDFLSIFTATPFSTMQNGIQTVNGQLLPVYIPNGSPTHPGLAYIFGLAIYPTTVGQVIVNDTIVHQNFGNLIGTLNFNDIRDVLNNHDSLGNPPGPYSFIYDDSGSGNTPGSQPSDGPGSLQDFVGKQGIGPWMLTEADYSETQTGFVNNFTLTLTPHQDLTKGINVVVQPGSWFYDYVDVPVGYTNLTVSATNESASVATPPLQLYVKLGSEPTLADTNDEVLLNNPGPLGPGNSISVGPPLTPGRYFVGIFNPSSTPANVYIIATLGFSPSAISTVDYRSGGPVPILDDAVTYSSIFVTNTDIIQDFNVGLRVDHPRISDLVFHLISPDGTRYLLMENRGGTTTNGCGATILNNFFSPASSSGGPEPSTNVINTGETTGSLSISYNFFPVPDQMTVYYEGNVITNFTTSNAGQFNINYGPGSSTFVTIIMNQSGNPQTNTAWEYTASGSQTNYLYLAFTEDTNLTTTPIKFAPPPFVPSFFSTNFILSDFETAAPGDYAASAPINDESVWTVISNQVSVVNDQPNAQGGSQFLALATGTITNTLPTIPGVKYTLTYSYRGPGIVSWWRGENNVNDTLNLNNGVAHNLTYATGEVDQAILENSTNAYFYVPASPSLNVGAGAGLTLDAWINPSSVSGFHPIAEWNNGNVNLNSTIGVQFWIGQFPGDNGVLCTTFLDSTGNNFIQIASPQHTLVANAFQHVAVTYNRTDGFIRLYVNGVMVTNSFWGNFAALTSYDLWSRRPEDCGGSCWTDGSFLGGLLDEFSLYGRALSASEIKAIYQKDSAGKFDRNPEIPAPQNLAEASVTIAGVSSTVIFGDNTNWQTGGVTFTATQTNTPLIISGIEPGMLLDSFSLSGASGGNLYYQPEQDISGINGTSAFGTWTLEIQDDRAGAANGTLQSWQLEFIFANTNFIPGPPNLIGGQPQTNILAPGEVLYYAVNVPVNADMATNILLFSTGPKNIWFDTNNPPTTNVFLFSGLNGSYTLSTTGSAPTNLVPGSTYYLVEQNPNSFTITNAIEVDFHFVPGILAPFAFTQPASAVTGTGAQLNGMATPNGLPATAWFQWGTTTAYGNQTPTVGVGTGSSVVYTTSPISGLLPNVPYHFRLVVSNALAVTHGFDQILDEANVVVWGANYAGQAKVPPGLSNVVAIAGAYDHSLALVTNETAVSWGDNLYGEATVPSGLSNLVAVAGGESYSLALQNNGTVAAWGSDIYPGAGETNVPSSLSNVVMIASGQYSSLALQTNGSVMAWGANLFNPTNLPAGLSNVVAIAGGTLHNLAIKNDGTVVAWGDNGAGQTNVPANLTNVVAIAAGSFHSLALKGDGTVVAWGFDSAGQTDVPTNLANVVAIAAGGFHSMALKNDGAVVAWGDDSAGQTSVPVGLSNVVAIASGYLHSLALTPQSTVNLTNVVLGPTNGVPQTNNILGHSITYYQINVPANADFATNILLFALQGPLNVWFDTNNPPTTNVFLFSGTNGSSTLSTTGTPPLIPGSTYYLGVQNTNSFTVTYAIEVDFHLLTNPPIFISGIIATNIGGTPGFLLTWYAPTNDEFLVHWTDSLTPPVAWGTFSNIVTYTSLTPTNGIGFFEFFDDGSQTPPGLPPMRFYRLELLQSPTNGVPQTNTVAAGGIDHFLINVPPNADFATNLLLSATGPVTMWFNQTNPPAGANPPDDLLMGGATNGISVLSTTSVPTNIVPGGTYWLGVQNTNSFAVTYGIEVNFHLQTVASSPISSLNITYTTNIVGTNGFRLTWFAPTNDVFQVQRTDTLQPQNWQFFTNFIYYTGPLTPTNGLFSFFDDGSQTPPGLPPMRFYRIILDGTVPSTHTNAVFISSVTSTNIAATNGFWFTWSAPTNYLFEMQWTTNLAPVITWYTFPNIIAYSTFVSPTNSLFNFFDNGSQGGLGPIRFYRLLLLP
ncbi:MAG: S8 family serine peptidase [Verrucomicrobiota bacterium]